jgi:molecular chaperone GrpE
MTKERHAKHEPAPKEPGPKEPAEDTAALKDRLLRLQADFDNFRKRTAREQADVCQRANEDLILRLLPVVDHFELGLRNAQIHHAESSVTEGFQLVYDQMIAALKEAGLTPVEAEGRAFDPQVHEAVSHVPSEEHPADTVITQTRRGYLLGSKLLRAAQVVVSSGPQAAPEPTKPDEPPPAESA